VNKKPGFSLPELLISLFLISLISSVLISSYLFNKQQYLALHEQLDLNFEVQWIHDLLADSLRRDGFSPCLPVDQLLVDDRPKQSGLFVHRMSEQFGELIHVLSPNLIQVTEEALLYPKQALLIADCEHAEIHQIVHLEKTAHGSLITLAKPLQYSYPSVTYVGRWIEEEWLIKPNRQGIKALYYNKEELSALIHALSYEKKQIQGKTVFFLTLGLEHDKTHHLRVVVRS
jgi:prepilin-type N-terminal cleavage/methylation domain-containing protein